MTALSPAELASFKFWLDFECDPDVEEHHRDNMRQMINALLDHIAATDPLYANGPVECNCDGAHPALNGAGPPWFPETHTKDCALRVVRTPLGRAPSTTTREKE